MLDEAKEIKRVLETEGLKLHGLHLEASAVDVTEVIGGLKNGINEEDLEKKYTSLCDPRFNSQQTCELLREFYAKDQ